MIYRNIEKNIKKCCNFFYFLTLQAEILYFFSTHIIDYHNIISGNYILRLSFFNILQTRIWTVNWDWVRYVKFVAVPHGIRAFQKEGNLVAMVTNMVIMATICMNCVESYKL